MVERVLCYVPNLHNRYRHLVAEMVTFVQLQDSQHPDFPAAIDLYEQAFPPSTKIATSLVIENIERNIYQLFVGYDTSRVVFMAMLYPMAGSEFVLLAYIATHPDYRGQGIGSTFLRQTLDRLQRDSQYLLLEVKNPKFGDDRVLRQRRVNFYRRIGAKVMEGVTFVAPPLSSSLPAELMLMVAPTYKNDVLPGCLVVQLMTQLYVQGYYRSLEELQQQSFIHNVSDFVNLV